MRALLKDKHFVKTVASVIKFTIACGMFCFILWKAPQQATSIVGYAGAFVLGGSKFKQQIGL